MKVRTPTTTMTDADDSYANVYQRKKRYEFLSSKRYAK
jgi:hypothetical protein